MSFRRLLKILGLCAAFLLPAAAAPLPTAKELAETAEWFDKLSWPDLKGKPYIEFSYPDAKKGAPGAAALGPNSVEQLIYGRSAGSATQRYRGFLLAEDAKTLTVFWDGTLESRTNFLQQSAYTVETWPKPPEGKGKAGKGSAYRILKLPAVVAAVLEQVQRHAAPLKTDGGTSMMAPSSSTLAVFVLARCCAWQGQRDLAERLETVLTKLNPDVTRIPTEIAEVLKQMPNFNQPPKDQTFREGLEAALSKDLLSFAKMSCTNPAVSRAEMHGRFARIARDFPGDKQGAEAGRYAKVLQQMVAEDEAHAKAARPVEKMTPEEQADEWIYQLRNQQGLPISMTDYEAAQGGVTMVVREKDGSETPWHQLVKLGLAAGPALIELIGDQRLTRQGGVSPTNLLTTEPAQTNDFRAAFAEMLSGRSQGGALNFGDCALSILAQISGRDFSKNEDGNPGADVRIRAARKAAATWWKNVGDKGLPQVLAEGVRAGDDESVAQASRLTALDPAEAVKSLVAGLAAAKNNNLRGSLMDALAAVKTEPAKVALQQEMLRCASLHARVAAAEELFERGQTDVVPVMVKEWEKWTPPSGEAVDSETEDVDPLMDFLVSKAGALGLRALAARFAQLPVSVRISMLGLFEGDDDSEEADPKERALHAEVDPALEELLLVALDDFSVDPEYTEMVGNDEYHFVRVCDLAGQALAKCWPKRFKFKWAITRVERDRFLEAGRARLRQGRAAKSSPLTEKRPEHKGAGKTPNVVAGWRWRGGDPLAKPALKAGQPVTADALLETLVALHKQLPPDCVGFHFSAERPGDHKGFVLEVEWLHGRRPKAGETWDDSMYVGLGKATISEDVTEEFLEPVTEENYATERASFTEALAGNPGKPLVIYFSGRLNGE